MTLNTNPLIRSSLFLNGFYGLVMLLSRTYRYTVIHESEWLRHYTTGGRVLFCTWHQQFLPALYYFRKFRPARFALMISQSRDGNIAAALARKRRMEPGSRVIESRGGKSAVAAKWWWKSVGSDWVAISWMGHKARQELSNPV